MGPPEPLSKSDSKFKAKFMGRAWAQEGWETLLVLHQKIVAQKR